MTKIIKRNKFLIVLALIAAVVISTIFVGQASPMFAHASTGENQAIEKVYTNLTLEQDFSDETILVVLNKTATFSFKTYTAEDFSEIGNVYVEEITAGSSQIVRQQRETNVSRQGHSVKVSDDYRRILKLTLQDKGKENIIDAVRKLERRDDVVSAEPSFAGSATATTPTEYPNLTAHPDLTKNNRLTNLHTQRWWIDQIDLPNAWDYEHNATGVTVAVVDTGIDSTHPDLEHRISAIPSVDYIGTDALADPNGHGTHVASTIGGEANNGGMAGVAWNVRFVSIRVFNAAGSGTANYAAQITESVEYAATNGIQIVSHSGGGNTGTTNTFNALLTQLQNYNGLFICAAGNNNVNNNNNSWFPGNVRAANVITVGATDTDDTRSWFSSWGTPTVANPDSRVDVFAPGSMIFAGYSQDRCTNATVNPTTGLRSCESWVNENFHHEDGYHFLSGTSMATPIVSGTAACCFRFTEAEIMV